LLHILYNTIKDQGDRGCVKIILSKFTYRKYKKLPYCRGPRDTLSVEILSTAEEPYKNALRKACNRWMTLKVTRDHCKWRDLTLSISGLW